MIEDRPALVTVPTELERQDAFIDGAALAGTVLIAWWLTLQGLGWWLAPLVVLVSVWTLTGEPAADVPYLGAVASGLRSKLGLRRAHEWLLAFWHYFRLAIWPVWKANCEAYWNSSRQRITDWRARLSAAIRWSLSRVCSWGSAIRYSLSARRAK